MEKIHQVLNPLAMRYETWCLVSVWTERNFFDQLFFNVIACIDAYIDSLTIDRQRCWHSNLVRSSFCFGRGGGGGGEGVLDEPSQFAESCRTPAGVCVCVCERERECVCVWLYLTLSLSHFVRLLSSDSENRIFATPPSLFLCVPAYRIHDVTNMYKLVYKHQLYGQRLF